MAVSDRDIDRVMKFGLEDFDWFWVVVELATGRRRMENEPATHPGEDRRNERDA